ncbi:Lipopolysaccharide kinase (Kdo/WaaP) family protein [Bifidobacterium commune]|uniref:Lipopolysaccharide kinase (Kdo/WaaP) family protein n=1 Tax=Bifidobacterium commune TaxID=1505727 RepID=A0A1C4H5H2_9BIFI|nr:Lipopolysaccharide kinase (Kdo/WaaP) family protein [Bifidobacterium commune]
MDPRALKATSVTAPDIEEAEVAEPSALKITAASSNPKMFTLPWGKPLASWPKELLANLPRGISRHVVRFVHVGDEIYAMKEITSRVAAREYELLRRLQKLELPTVTPIAVVTGRHTRDGEPLESILVSKQLKFSLPYRALFAGNLRPDTTDRLIDALAVLMVRLHLSGFYWGDVSLSNVLFLRDADAFSAFLVDAETGVLHTSLTVGQREYDMDLARTNIIGELMDLGSGKLLPDEVDEVAVGDRLLERYHSLWGALTDQDDFGPDEMWKIEKRINKLNDLGFDVDELEVKTADDGKRVLVRPRVVDAGYASRKLLRLTGLDVQENQARRLLNDLDAYRASTWRDGEELEIVATDWMREVFEPVVRMIPRGYRSKIEPAQFFHEVLQNRWYMAEKVGHDIPTAVAASDYIKNNLPKYNIDSKTLAEINADADSGVVDDTAAYSGSSDGAASAEAEEDGDIVGADNENVDSIGRDGYANLLGGLGDIGSASATDGLDLDVNSDVFEGMWPTHADSFGQHSVADEEGTGSGAASVADDDDDYDPDEYDQDAAVWIH